MRPKFIIDLYKDLKKIQKEITSNEQLRVMINDIRKFIRGIWDEDEYETNQVIIGIAELFCRNIVKV